MAEIMKTISTQTRNVRLDILKVICCILVIVLHSPPLCGGIVGIIIRSITAIAVPSFMAVSGYLIFYLKEYTLEKYIKVVSRYVAIFLIWDTIYLVYVWIRDVKQTEEYMSFIQFAATNSEGWHLWYLKVYIQILLVYPIIRTITREKKLCILYSVIWTVMIPLKYSLTAYLAIDFTYLRLLQLPFFQFNGVTSGTVMGYYPTECLGYFIFGGLMIDTLQKNVRYINKTMLCIGAVGLTTTIIEYRSSVLAVEPLQINVLFMMCGFISMIYMIKVEYIPEKVIQIITWISDQTLGAYIIQGFMFRISKYVIAGFILEDYIGNICVCLLTLFLSFTFAAVIHKILPSKIYQYLM